MTNMPHTWHHISPPADGVRLTWLGQAGFAFVTAAGKRIFLDPYPLWTAHRRETEPSGQSWMVADPRGSLAGVWESNTIFSGGWFWNGPGAKSVVQKIEHYYLTVGRGATFLPNFAPDPRGLMTDEVHACAAAFGAAIRKIESGIVGEAAGIGATLELPLTAPGDVNHVVLMEDLAAGQRVCKFRVDGPGGWQVDGAGAGRDDRA